MQTRKMHKLDTKQKIALDLQLLLQSKLRMQSQLQPIYIYVRVCKKLC